MFKICTITIKIPTGFLKGLSKHVLDFEKERQYFRIVFKHAWSRFILMEEQ